MRIKLILIKPAHRACGKILVMGHAIKTITLHPAVPQAGCGACLHDSGAPVCRAVLGEACLAPELHGSPTAVQRVMAALGPALGFTADARNADAGAGQVLRLSVLPGEVDLVLSGALRCGGAALAEAAFAALRGLLPDTDIYVRNAA